MPDPKFVPIKIKEGKKYTEETKYFLPIGKAIHSRVIIDVLQKARYEIIFLNFIHNFIFKRE